MRIFVVMITNNGQSAAKSLIDSELSYEEGSTTIPQGSTP